MADLPNGQSEIATVTLSLPNYSKEIKNWKHYSLTSSFLQPCDQWNFTISAEDATLYQELLVPGAQVQLKINGNIQCTGYIDVRDIQYDASNGIVVTINGRDLLARLVNGGAPPKIKLLPTMTLADLIGKFLPPPWNLGKLYNTEDTNLNIITGRPNGASVTTQTINTQQVVYATNADGSIKQNADGTFESSLVDVPVTQVVSNRKPGLKTIPIKKLKCQAGENAYAFLDRCLRRCGLVLKAMADGSGVMVVSPTFDGASYGKITQRSGDAANNILACASSVNWSTQPSVIVAEGFGGGQDFGKSMLQVIMVNELIGLDANGNYLPEIQQIKAAYQKAFLVPIRQELIPRIQPLNTQHSYCPLYIKDDESKTLDELKFAVTRRMAQLQMSANTLSYTLIGHTNDQGEPWAVNTIVDVDDDILGVHERMWILSRTFNKSVSGGTTTTLRLIKPYTLQLG